MADSIIRNVCRARTGLASPRCPWWPHGAHACHDDAGHASWPYVHTCACEYYWTCLTGSVSELLDSLDMIQRDQEGE